MGVPGRRSSGPPTNFGSIEPLDAAARWPHRATGSNRWEGGFRFEVDGCTRPRYEFFDRMSLAAASSA